MARADDSDIKCEPNGNFKPLQCSPVEESPTNVSSTSEEMTRSRRTRTRTMTRQQQSCRCVEPVNGTTIEGSELLLGVRDKKPNCDDGKKFPHQYSTVMSDVYYYYCASEFVDNVLLILKN